jgi:hypothetical protein
MEYVHPLHGFIFIDLAKIDLGDLQTLMSEDDL